MDEDDLAFSQMVDGVKQLSLEPRAVRKSQEASKDTLKRRREAATASTQLDKGLSTEFAVPLTSIDELSYQKPGVQHGVFKKLRLGQYPAEATLDLHRRTVEQARQDVLQCIDESMRYGLRSILINHGKAHHGPDKVAMIKSYVNAWLPQLEPVLAFHSAKPHHGGTGACYVLLKKGVKQKQETAERLAKRLKS